MIVFRSGNKLQADLVVGSPSPAISNLVLMLPTGHGNYLSGYDLRTKAKHRLDIQRSRPDLALVWWFHKSATHAAIRIPSIDLGCWRHSRFPGRKEGGQSKAATQRAHSKPVVVLARSERKVEEEVYPESREHCVDLWSRTSILSRLLVLPRRADWSTGRRNRILRPVVGSDNNLELDHQTLVSQTPDGRVFQTDVGFP